MCVCVCVRACMWLLRIGFHCQKYIELTIIYLPGRVRPSGLLFPSTRVKDAKYMYIYQLKIKKNNLKTM